VLRFILLTVILSGSWLSVQAGDLLRMAIVNRSTGERLRIWHHQGKKYVVGHPGDRYAIKLHNRTAGRILVVLSVDGVNAINGKTAAVNQPGYVLDPYKRQKIVGWRKNMDEAAVFYFTELPRSYAARTGRPGNVGVIGAAVYQEKRPMTWYRDPEDEDMLQNRPAAPSGRYQEAPSNIRRDRNGLGKAYPRPGVAGKANEGNHHMSPRVGTGHGERVDAPSTNTIFHRRTERPAEVIAIYYDSRANLVARGIIQDRYSSPEPFPGEFVPDPPQFTN